MKFYGYYECDGEPSVNNAAYLESFTIVIADENDENRMKMPIVGTGDGRDCPGYAFTEGMLVRAAIYADESEVYGIRFQSPTGVSDIGLL